MTVLRLTVKGLQVGGGPVPGIVAIILLLISLWNLLFNHQVMSDSLGPHGLHQASLFFTILYSWPRFMSTESVIPSNHLIFCDPLLFLPSGRVFSNESVLQIRWPKYWSFNFSISSSNEYSALISFRIDWFDVLAFQGTLKSLQPHSLKASFLQCSAFCCFSLAYEITQPIKTNHSEMGHPVWSVFPPE